jgi:hypothetical protein
LGQLCCPAVPTHIRANDLLDIHPQNENDVAKSSYGV